MILENIMFLNLLFIGKMFTLCFRQIKYKIKYTEKRQGVKRSYNFDEALDFLFDSGDEDHGNIFDDSDMSWSENENEEDNSMLNIPPLDETLE